MEGRNYRATLFLVITRWLRVAAGFLERGAEAVQLRAGPATGELEVGSAAGATLAQDPQYQEAGGPPAHWLEDVRRLSRGQRTRWRQVVRSDSHHGRKRPPVSGLPPRGGPGLRPGAEPLPAADAAAAATGPLEAGLATQAPALETCAVPAASGIVAASGGSPPATASALHESGPDVATVAEPVRAGPHVGPSPEESGIRPPRPAILLRIRTGVEAAPAPAAVHPVPGKEMDAGPVPTAEQPLQDRELPGRFPDEGERAEPPLEALPGEEAPRWSQEPASSQESSWEAVPQPEGPEEVAPHSAPDPPEVGQWWGAPDEVGIGEVQGPLQGENRSQASNPRQPELGPGQEPPARWADLGVGQDAGPVPVSFDPEAAGQGPGHTPGPLPEHHPGSMPEHRPGSEPGHKDRWPALLDELAYEGDDWEPRQRAMRRLERLDREQRGRLCKELPF